jgi:hypothetical protein
MIILAIHYSRLHDHEVIWVYVKLVATQLLKDDSLKAIAVNPCQIF